MSKGKTDAVWDQYYAPHLGRVYAGNRSINRKGVLRNLYVRILCELATNRYKWVKLPESINPRNLEVTLMRNGLSVFYKDPEYDMFFALAGTPSGELNMQNDPVSYQVYGNRFINKNLHAFPYAVRVRDERGRFASQMVPEDCIPIWSNYMRMSDWDIIAVYSERLAEFDLTIEINAKNARRPKVVPIDPNMVLSITNINRQIDEGNTFIPVNSATFDQTVGNLTALDLGVDPKTIEALQVARTRVWNECMGLLGINNANQDKRERLVSDEVDANNDQVESMRWVNLNARRQAAHQIANRWPELKGLSVDFHTTKSVSTPEPFSSDDIDAASSGEGFEE